MGAFDTGIGSIASGPTDGPGVYGILPQGGYTSNLLSSMSATSQGEPILFMGYEKSSMAEGFPSPKGSAALGHRDLMVPKGQTLTSLLQQFDSLSHKDYEAFKKKLIAAGYASDSSTPIDVRNGYVSMLNDVYGMQQTGAALTPTAFLNNLIRQQGLNPHDLSGSSGSGSEPKTYTNTATSVYDLTPDNARATLREALQAKLGRDPTQAEIRDFIDAAQTRATNNPTTSTTTYHTDGNGNTTSNTSTDQGFSEANLQEMALRRAKQAPDYAKYQASSLYYPALVSALGATVS